MSTADVERINGFALRPLEILYANDWGPDNIEIDRTANEVKFVYKGGLDEKSGGAD
jgi:hypothetical protein